MVGGMVGDDDLPRYMLPAAWRRQQTGGFTPADGKRMTFSILLDLRLFVKLAS